MREPVGHAELFSTATRYAYALSGVVVPLCITVYTLRKTVRTLELRKVLVPLSQRSQQEKYQDSIKLEVKKLERLGISSWAVASSLIMVLEGYIGYYELP